MLIGKILLNIINSSFYYVFASVLFCWGCFVFCRYHSWLLYGHVSQSFWKSSTIFFLNWRWFWNSCMSINTTNLQRLWVVGKNSWNGSLFSDFMEYRKQSLYFRVHINTELLIKYFGKILTITKDISKKVFLTKCFQKFLQCK